MNEIKKRALVSIVGLVSAGLFSVGCGSSSNTTGTAGTSGGAGTTGSGGTTGGGGTTGAGGTSAACAAPPAALITDFTAGSTTAQVGAPYTGAATGLTAPVVDTTTGALVITVATGAATAGNTYAYVGLPFNACVGTTHTGVTFNIGGTLSTGCTIQFSAVDKEHSTPANNGTCTAANCYASAALFTLPATATDVPIEFASQTGGGADATAAVVDPSELLNIQWQLNVPTDGCTGTITIDNVTFH